MKVVHCKKERYDVLIDRTTIWGNPFVIGKDGTRKEVIQKFRVWIKTQPELLARVEELRDKTLGCWCSPLACHGELYLEILYPENTLENFLT